MAPRSKRRAVAADGAGELPEDERAFQKVVRVVNIREQSTVTMRRKLEQAGFGEAAVEAEVERAMAVLSRKRFTAKNKREAAYRTLVGKGYASDAASTAARLWAEGG